MFKYRILIYDRKGKLLHTYVYDEQKTCLDFYQKLIEEKYAEQWFMEVIEVLKQFKGSEV